MIAMIKQPLQREYEDSLDHSVVNVAKERAYRQGFLESTRHIVNVWAHPPGPPPRRALEPKTIGELLANRRCDPFKQMEAAWQRRQRVRERFAVYGPGDAGRKTHHLGYRPGHALAAARLRGRHHAMVFATEPWDGFKMFDIDIFDPKLLCPWLREVETWASKPIKLHSALSVPPRLMESASHTGYLDEDDQPNTITLKKNSPAQNPRIEPVSVPIAPWKVVEQPPVSPPPPSPPPRIRLTRADQIEIRPPHWLLRGILERDTFAQVFGDPGCGKSFLAIDWACRVATGTPWRSQVVNGGPVVYIAGEGQQGFGRRIRAWSEHHQVSLSDVPLYLAPAVAIPDPSDLIALISAIDTGVASVGHPVLIVLDTLARNFGSGDEGSTQDMSRFVSACDALRGRYNSTILVVHHTGHADKSRARGAIALKAALDAEYRLVNNEPAMKLTSTKMKDAETPPPLALELVSVDIPGLLNDYGNQVTSAAIKVLDIDTSAIESGVKATKPRGKWQDIGLEVAQRLVADGEDSQATVKDWHEACGIVGMRQSTRYDVLTKLCEREAIVIDHDVICVPSVP